MKIKTWLLFSYLIVMILPLAAAYFLFAWIQAYNNDQKVEEYFRTSTRLQNMIIVLDNPELYKQNIERPNVDELVNSQVSIALFNPNGLVLYSSDPATVPLQFALGKEVLYQNLYSLNQGYRSYSYKQPVLAENELVGFFEVQIARDEWIGGVTNRSWYIFGLFIVIFVLTFLIVVLLVDRKLNRRLNHLMDQMTTFAKSQEVKETPTENDEIGILTRHFFEMQKQIEAARKAIEKEQQDKEYMIATISHDLKTPLTSISAYAESLIPERELSVNERTEYRDIIVDKANYMKQMLDDLLMYTILQSPKYEMELVEVDGNEFFEMLVSDYELLCREKKIILQVDCHVTGYYRLNPKQLIRVMDNLMSNAIQHTGVGGQIWVAAVSSDFDFPEWVFEFVKESDQFGRHQSMFLIIQNIGKGIPKEKVAHVFDPLYQADEARSKKDARGTGLGLSITKQIVEKHGGDVRLFSDENLGTCVMCRLPKIDREGDNVEIQ